MATLVVDSSVAVKFFLKAEGGERARKLFDAGHEIIAPDLILVEISNVLWKKLRVGDIDLKHAAEIIDGLPSLFAMLVSADLLVAHPFRLAAELNHAVYDFIYLSLAGARDSRVITADERLIRKLSGTRLSTPVAPLSSI